MTGKKTRNRGAGASAAVAIAMVAGAAQAQTASQAQKMNQAEIANELKAGLASMANASGGNATAISRTMTRQELRAQDNEQKAILMLRARDALLMDGTRVQDAASLRAGVNSTSVDVSNSAVAVGGSSSADNAVSTSHVSFSCKAPVKKMKPRVHHIYKFD